MLLTSWSLMSRNSLGIAPLAGFFERWLRDEAAALMQPEGLSQRYAWRHEFHSDMDLPYRFTLDGVVCDARKMSPEKILRRGRGLDAYPVAAAWHSFVWLTTCSEVGARFAEDHHVHLVLSKEPFLEQAYFMRELYRHLFLGAEETTSHADQW